MGVRDLEDGSWLLLIPLRLPDPAFEMLDARQVHPLLTGFASLGSRMKLSVHLLEAPGAGRATAGLAELQLREELLTLFGPGALPLPGALENGPLLAALRMSTRYMGEGFREAAVEMFSSPLFLISVGFSVLLYFSAWLAPEPLFTKAFAATLTARLTLVFGVVELARVAKACLLLYQDAEAARTPQELEAASKRFGTTIGGTGLRVVAMVASMGIARMAPDVPEGGLQTLMQSWRMVGQGGAAAELIGQAKIVADGTVIVSGVAAGRPPRPRAVRSACAPRRPIRAAAPGSRRATARLTPGATRLTTRPSRRIWPPGRRRGIRGCSRTRRK